MGKNIFSFLGGVHPSHNKVLTESKPVIKCKVPSTVIIPMQQHIGAPCEPTVKKGDYVKMGQKIGQPRGFVSAPVHSSVSGVVKSVEPYNHSGGDKVLSVIIENDGQDTMDESIRPNSVDDLNPQEIINIILNAGIVGMGGAAFPTHVKLSPPQDKKVDTIIINGAECEPYLTSDHRLMIEHPNDVVSGLLLIMKVLNVQNGIIAIEDNKPDAIEAVKKAASGYKNVDVVTVKTKYPQGAEKQLITSITKREVPSGGLPMDVGVIVNNVGTAAAISKAVKNGTPLIERIVTVSGGAVNEPNNLLVRIGTPFSDIVEFCGGFKEEPYKVISGGPMMGIAQFTLDVPVVKGTSGILLLTEAETTSIDVNPCIRCGRCIKACPINLMPLNLSAYSLNQNYEMCEKLHAMDCIECGCCSYICPAARPLTESIRMAKKKIMLSKKRTAKNQI